MNFNPLIKEAIDISQKSDIVRAKIGAVLYNNNGSIIASAYNQRIYASVDKKRFSLHAEESLILKILKLKVIPRIRKNSLNILVVRWKPSSSTLMGNAKPCDRCKYLLDKIGIRVYYSNERGEIVRYNGE